DLPGTELGYAAGGDIWIDRTAAGWGWAVNGRSGMDLVTVVTHELGHVLGFEHSATGVMEAALAPGVRVLPAALPGTGTSVVAAAAGDSGGAAGPRAGELGLGLSGRPLATSSPTETTDAAFAPAVRGGVTLSQAVSQDRAGTQRSVSAV